MPSTAAAPALEKPACLSEAEALKILNDMPRMVAASNSKLEPGLIVTVAYEVQSLNRSFVFPPQPFMILREITFREFCQSLPAKTRAGRSQRRYFYEISTD